MAMAMMMWFACIMIWPYGYDLCSVSSHQAFGYEQVKYLICAALIIAKSSGLVYVGYEPKKQHCGLSCAQQSNPAIECGERAQGQ